MYLPTSGMLVPAAVGWLVYAAAAVAVLVGSVTVIAVRGRVSGLWAAAPASAARGHRGLKPRGDG
jgi:hypothetical protein